MCTAELEADREAMYSMMLEAENCGVLKMLSDKASFKWGGGEGDNVLVDERGVEAPETARTVMS